MADFKDFVVGRSAKAPLSGTETVPIVDGGITKKTTAQSIANLAPIAVEVSQAEAEAGTETAVRSFSPLRVFQAVAAKLLAGISTLTVAYSSTVKSTRTVSSNGVESLVLTRPSNTLTFKIVPDGGISVDHSGYTTGNTRGQYAIDFQAIRNSVSQVASGVAAVIAGGSNNTASGIRAAVSGGYYNTSSGDLSVVSGGSYNVASAPHACIPGSIYAANGIPYSLALASGPALGQHQMGVIPLGKVTSDATPTVLDLNNTETYRPVIPAKAAWHFRGMCIAYGPTYKASAWSIEGVLVRDAAAGTVIIGTPVITLIAQSAEMAGCAVAVSADDTNESLKVTVTGLAATSIYWTCTVFYSQTARP